MTDHAFIPSATDPDRCGFQLPSCAPYPAPLTQPCWGLASQHPTPHTDSEGES